MVVAFSDAEMADSGAAEADDATDSHALTEADGEILREDDKPKPERKDRSDDPSIPHGTAGGYTNHRCSCRKCKRAFSRLSSKGRLKREARGLPPDDPRHGTQNGYGNWGCRCERCRDAHNDYKRRAHD